MKIQTTTPRMTIRSIPPPSIDCDLKHIGEDEENPGNHLYECQRPECGRIFSHFMPANQIHLRCRIGSDSAERRQNTVPAEELADAAESLGLTFQDARGWLKALARWHLAGRPRRTDEEVAACLLCCVGDDRTPRCEHYRDEWGGRCKLCGCRVNKSQMATFNKARMATENCPAGKWSKRRANELPPK
jgi:hypothetical protein